MKAYVTKWAMTRGIVEADLFAAAGSDAAMTANGIPVFRGEWFLSLDEAKAEFERQKQARLVKMVAQMEKLRAREPKVVRMKEGKLGGRE